MEHGMARRDEVRRRHEGTLRSIEGVVGVGVGERDGVPCINVYIERDDPNIRAAIPSVIEGIPVSILESGGPQAV